MFIAVYQDMATQDIPSKLIEVSDNIKTEELQKACEAVSAKYQPKAIGFLDVPPKWIEVELIIEGALYDLTSGYCDSPDDMERITEWVEQNKFEAKLCGSEKDLWEIYSYDHTCIRPDLLENPEDYECVCRQYDSVHGPAWTSNASTEKERKEKQEKEMKEAIARLAEKMNRKEGI